MALITGFYIDQANRLITVIVHPAYKVFYKNPPIHDGGSAFTKAVEEHTNWLPGMNYFDGRSIVNVVAVNGKDVWDWSTKSWVYSLTIEDARVKKWASIKKSRTSVEYSSFLFGSHVYDADENSQRRISGAVSLATLSDESFSLDWTTANNTVVGLSRSKVIGLGVALGTHVISVHALARDKRARIDAATTPEEVEAIVW